MQDVDEVRIVERNLHKRLKEMLRQTSQEDDVLLFFILNVLEKLAFLHFLINIVLMIWMSQTIFSSNLKQIPRSIFLLSPLLTMKPIKTIEISQDGMCAFGYEQLVLSTLPSITLSRLKNQNVTRWRDPYISFCVKRVKVERQKRCLGKQLNCSGYCVNMMDECPITSIRMIENTTDKQFHEHIFYESNAGNYFLVYSRHPGIPILDLKVFVNETCSNQFYLYDDLVSIKNFTELLQSGCGYEGNLDKITQKIDSQPYSQLLRNNGYASWNNKSNISTLVAKLHYVQKIKIDEDNHYCKDVMKVAHDLPRLLPTNPFLPSFSKSLLITALCYMMTSIVWWVTVACGVERYGKEVAIVVSAIQLLHFVILKSKYSHYQSIIGVNEIQNCVRDEIEALKHWQYGITNHYIFLVIVFENTVFLAFEILCLILLKTLYYEV